jgi:hypothetical protein
MFPPHGSLSRCILDKRSEVTHIGRLLDKTRGSSIESTNAILRTAMSGHHDNSHVGINLTQLPQKRKTTFDSCTRINTEIKNNNLWIFSAHHPLCIFCSPRSTHGTRMHK